MTRGDPPVLIGIRAAADGPAVDRVLLPGPPPLEVSVVDVGLACCAEEVAAALDPRRATGAAMPSGPDPADPADPVRAVDVLVIAGTLTDVMVPAVLTRYRSYEVAPWVVSFGACANCGGPYWDSYAVTKGVDQLIPVDLYVPGCPPRPEALLAGLQELAGPVSAGARPGERSAIGSPGGLEE